MYEIKNGIEIPNKTRYPFPDIEVGDCFDMDGDSIPTIHSAARNWEKRAKEVIMFKWNETKENDFQNYVDAERYRWLRDRIEGVHVEPGARDSGIYTWCLQIVDPIPVLTEGSLPDDEVDNAIDARRIFLM